MMGDEMDLLRDKYLEIGITTRAGCEAVSFRASCELGDSDFVKSHLEAYRMIVSEATSLVGTESPLVQRLKGNLKEMEAELNGE